MPYMKTVDGVDYISTEERERCSCVGYAALTDLNLCNVLNGHVGYTAYYSGDGEGVCTAEEFCKMAGVGKIN